MALSANPDMKVCTLHWYFSEGHLLEVVQEMRRRGPPELRGFHDPGAGVLLKEGTHRIRAAGVLGLTPVIRLVPWWRSRESLQRARYALRDRGLEFERVDFLDETAGETPHGVLGLQREG